MATGTSRFVQMLVAYPGVGTGYVPVWTREEGRPI